jgi:hypothetical protein
MRAWPGLAASLVALGIASAGCGDDDVTPAPDAAVDARVLADVWHVEPDPEFDESYEPYGTDVTVTTLLQTRRSRYPMDEFLVDPWERVRIPMDEVGRRHPQPGEPHLLRDDLEVEDATPGERKSLLYLAHLSDAQLIDTQSPAYVPTNKYTVLGDSMPAFHQNGPLVPHLLDAVVQTANQFGIQRPYDLIIHTGDAIEDSQANEVEWFITIMDGGLVYPDSGDADDPIPGPDNDAWDPFAAGGIPSGVPWYAVVGNHDLSVNGNFPRGLIHEANEEPWATDLPPLLAEFKVTLPGVGTADRAPNVLTAEEMPAFTVDLQAFDVEDLWNQEYIESFTEGPIVPDDDRMFMDGCGFIDAHFTTGTEPVGHGFTQAGRTNCTGNYTVDPVPGLPLRMIVIDTGPHVGGAEGILTPPLNPDGSVNQDLVGDPAHDQIAWLVAELDRATADNVAVIMASHHASSNISNGNMFSDLFELFFPEEEELNAMWRRHFIYPEESLPGSELRELLTEYPCVILHLVGHSHANRINAVCPGGTLIDGVEATDGEVCGELPADKTVANGYWEVMAASSRDFPNQFRITEIVDNGNGTGSIYTTVVDAQGDAGSLHELGLVLALAGKQVDRVHMEDAVGTLADRNVELQFAWPDELIPVLATTDAATKIESVTTLMEPAPGLPVLPTWR